MAWRLIEAPEGEREDDLTSGELIGVSIMMAQHMGEPHNELNVYYRAWEKLQPQVSKAMDE